MKLLQNLLTGALAVVFVASSGMALWLSTDYRAGSESYENAQALVFGSEPTEPSAPAPREASPEPPEDPELFTLRGESMLPVEVRTAEPVPGSQETGGILDIHAAWLAALDLEALKAVNPDVIGWIFVPGTSISYPLVQGEDNQHYLNYTWDNQQSAVGAVFMEATNQADFSDFSTIIYAHNLRNGTMFSPLHNYKDPAFRAENPHVYIVNDAGVWRYEIYAAYEADITGATYWQDVESSIQRQEYLDYGLENSILDTGIVPTIDQPVLTLSTCTGYTYARRWVVQARLEGQVTAEAPAPPASKS